MLLRLWHAVSNNLSDVLEAAVPPEPNTTREIGADGRADAVFPVTTRTGASGHFSVEHLPAECDLVRGRPRRHREVGRSARIGIHALGRKGARRSLGFGGWRRCGLDRCIGITVIAYAPDPAGLVVGNIQSAIWSDRETRGAMNRDRKSVVEGKSGNRGGRRTAKNGQR